MCVGLATGASGQFSHHRWCRGEALLTGGDTLRGQISHQTDQDLVVIRTTDGRLRTLTPHQVDTFVLHDTVTDEVHHYRSIHRRDERHGYSPRLFYEVIFAGEHVSLLARLPMWRMRSQVMRKLALPDQLLSQGGRTFLKTTLLATAPQPLTLYVMRDDATTLQRCPTHALGRRRARRQLLALMDDHRDDVNGFLRRRAYHLQKPHEYVGAMIFYERLKLGRVAAAAGSRATPAGAVR